MVILCNQTLDTPDEFTSQSKSEFELYIVKVRKVSYRRSIVRNCKISTNAAAKKAFVPCFLNSTIHK